jgi:prolyl-tRNA synthetase
MGIRDKTYLTYAGGGTFSKISHEFQTVTESGEDTILICDVCHVAVNEVDVKLFPECPECKGKWGASTKSVEVANIFPLQSKYSDAFGMQIKGVDGKDHAVIMGCYGIGVTRLMGVIAELFHDEKGLMWPHEVAPFRLHLISLGKESRERADRLYHALQKKNIEVFYDDREEASAGEKFADSDMMGIPTRVIMSAKTLAENKVEVKDRASQEVKLMSVDNLISHIHVR